MALSSAVSITRKFEYKHILYRKRGVCNILYRKRGVCNILYRKRGVCKILHASACACLRWDAWHAGKGWRGEGGRGEVKFFLNLGQLNISYRVDSLSSSSTV